MDNSSSSILWDILHRFLETERLDKISNMIHTTNRINMIKQLTLVSQACLNHKMLSLEIHFSRSKKKISIEAVAKVVSHQGKTQILVLWESNKTQGLRCDQTARTFFKVDSTMIKLSTKILARKLSWKTKDNIKAMIEVNQSNCQILKEFTISILVKEWEEEEQLRNYVVFVVQCMELVNHILLNKLHNLIRKLGK